MSKKMPRRVSPKRWDNKLGMYVAGAFAVVTPFVLFSYFAFGDHSKVPSTLQLVSIVFRHGDRTPTSFYPNDPYKDPKYWAEGLGALTKEGKRKMYKLGKLFRERYAGFLADFYSPDDVYVFSSDNDRCLMSAQLCLAGLYPPAGEQIWNKDIEWQPIPVHTIPRNLDKLIAAKKPCRKYEKELSETYSVGHFAQINAENAELYKYLSEHSGMEVKNIMHVEKLYNTLQVEAKLGFQLPNWTKKVFNDNMKKLAGLSLAALTFTNTTKRLKGGTLLSEIVAHTSRKVLGSLNPDRVLYLYSAHDVTIISVLRTLGFQHLFQPDYGAAIIFELHRPSGGGDHTVQLLYSNNTEHLDAIALEIPGCGKMCKLKNFLEITKPFIPEDWEAECEAV